MIRPENVGSSALTLNDEERNEKKEKIKRDDTSGRYQVNRDTKRARNSRCTQSHRIKYQRKGLSRSVSVPLKLDNNYAANR